MKLKTEADGRMFPVTDSSATIAECLREAAKKAGVKVEVGTNLLGVKKGRSDGFRLEVRSGAQALHLQTKKVADRYWQ